MQTPPTAISEGFLADHERLEVLFERLLGAFEESTPEEKQRLWKDCESGLLKHLESEETHLIPALLRLNERDARVLVQEHRHLRARLAELGSATEPDALRLETVRNFIDEVRAHGRSENRLLYKWADAHLDEPLRVLAIGALASTPTG